MRYTPLFIINLPYSGSRSAKPMFSRGGHVSKPRWWLIMGMAELNGTFFIRVNTRLLSYRRNENAEEDGTERRGQGGGMGRVSRRGNASAVNEQTLIFSRTKPIPLTTTYLPPTTSQALCSGTRKRGSAERRWDDTASAMHTTAIIIVRQRKKGETTTNKRGWRARLVWREG